MQENKFAISALPVVSSLCTVPDLGAVLKPVGPSRLYGTRSKPQYPLSAKILVVGENRTIKRTLALTLVNKQVYEWHVHMSSVKRRPTTQQVSLPRCHEKYKPHVYEHHIEPKLEKLDIGNSPFMAYLEGYAYDCAE